MKHNRTICGLAVLLSTLTACANSGDNPTAEGLESVEAISLLGTPLYRSDPEGDAADRMLSQLEEARDLHEKDPFAIDGFVWYGRRTAYLGRYRDAVAIYSEGLEIHPGEPHLLRHRGHRYISLRELDLAIQDFLAAAEAVEGFDDEVEPDGQPNAAGIPTSTLQTNIWYHLGLAYYLKGEFDASVDSFRNCFDLAENDDMRVAAADWLYMALRRSGSTEEAEAAIAFVEPEMDILENQAYHRRLLMYRGILPPDSVLGATQDADALQLATLGYGVGNFHLMNGDTERAKEVFDAVLETGFWAAFGYIAAEADLSRMREIE